LEKEQQEKWYDRKGIVVLLIFIFWPIGLYGLIKSEKPKKPVIIRVIIVLVCIIGLLIILDFILPEVDTDLLSLGQETIESLVGQKVPYGKWSEWGSPETLSGTDNNYWVVYLDKANISFVSNKVNDKILFANFGRNGAIRYVKTIR